MAKPEDELCKKVKNRLSYWQSQKVVIHTDDIRRLNLRQIKGMFISSKPKGSPDLVSYFKHNNSCGILFIELKTENDKHRVEQLEFMMKFKDLTNVHYLILRDPNQIDITLENITGYVQNTLDNIVI